MESVSDLKALYALQQVDSEIDILKHSFSALDKGIGERTAYDAAKSAYEQAQIVLKETETSHHDTILERDSVEGKRASEEKRLYSGSVQSPKELQAMQKEVEMLEANRKKLDAKIDDLSKMHESAQSRLSETKSLYAEAHLALKKKIDSYNKASSAMGIEAKSLTKQRSEAAKVIPADLLKRYETLRKSRDGIAVVLLNEEDDSCGGCHMSLPTNTAARVREGRGIVTCDNCGRMVYYCGR